MNKHRFGAIYQTLDQNMKFVTHAIITRQKNKNDFKI